MRRCSYENAPGRGSVPHRENFAYLGKESGWSADTAKFCRGAQPIKPIRSETVGYVLRQSSMGVDLNPAGAQLSEIPAGYFTKIDTHGVCQFVYVLRDPPSEARR